MPSKKSKNKRVQTKKSKKVTKRVIKKVKTAIAIPTKRSRRKEKPSKKPLRRKKVKIHAKKEVVVKTREKAKKVEELFILAPEDVKRLSEILSRPFVRELLVDVGGENAIAIIRNFDRAASDEDISKKLKIKISDVRAALNKLHNEGLVMYNRHKDSETGWYSYSWYLNKDRMERWAEEQMKKFENKGHGNSNEFYVCPFCGVSTITGFETALEKGFKCEICSKQLEFLDEERMQKLGIVEQRTFVRSVR